MPGEGTRSNSANHRTRRTLGRAAAATVMLLLGWLWFGLLSPWGYTPPSDLAPIAENVPHHVFAYGTLRNPLVRGLVIGRHVPTEPATLDGYLRTRLDIKPQAGARTQGEVFVVDAEGLRRLDRYERLGLRYERVEETLTGGTHAWVYRRIAKH